MTSPLAPIDRFRADLEALSGSVPERLGLAVSGGPDSLALLLLAADALPGRVAAATVDHRLRPEAAAEAAGVAAVCRDLSVPHEVLRPDWDAPPEANVQAEARAARYRALGRWADCRGLDAVATAHHADDQAETLLMRLARGSGLAGLAGVRASGSAEGTRLVRPLLGWRKAELEAIVRSAGLAAADDPTNDDERFDRTRARRLLARAPWLEPERLAASAAHLAEAEEGLGWAVAGLWSERAVQAEGQVALNGEGLPRELQRRLLAEALRRLGAGEESPGPKLSRLLDALRAGRPATLAGIKAEPGPPWRLIPAPPRRR